MGDWPTGPDVYFRSGYGLACAVGEAGEWVGLSVHEDAWLMPLVARPVDTALGVDGVRDAQSPYGYSGVYADPALSASDRRDAWEAALDALRSMGVVSLFLRHSPLVPQDVPTHLGRAVVRDHPTVAMTLSDPDAAWSALSGRARTAVRKAERLGMRADVRRATRDDLAPDAPFRTLYEATMRRLSARPEYVFGDAYYDALLDGLGEDLWLAGVEHPARGCVSAALLMRHGPRLHYHLSGSDAEGARGGANNLMLWHAARYFAGEGVDTFHLGGGVSADDGLFRFKRSMGTRVLSFEARGVVVDEERYVDLTRRHAARLGTSPEALSSSGYFPAYRAGGPRA
ncbi:hypothetical protein GCM10027194_16230 [Thalassiella azotivora]